MLGKNSIWSIAGSALPALTALASIPLLLLILDSRVFSVTSLLLSIALFFFVYDFGIGRTVTYFSSTLLLAGNTQELNNLLGQALLWSLIIGIFSLALVAGSTDLFVEKWLNAPPEYREETALAFKIAALGIPASMLAHLVRGVLEGRQDFRTANICKMFSGGSLFISPLTTLVLGHAEPVDLSSAITMSRYISFLFYVYMAGKFMTVTKAGFKPNLGSPFLKYGIWTALAGFISSMFVYGDRFFVAGYLDSDSLSAYIASQDILIRYLLVPWAMATVLLPQLTRMADLGQSSTAIYFAHQARIHWMSFTFLMLVLTLVWWITPAINSDLFTDLEQIIVSVQAVGIYFCALAQLPLIYLYASGRPRLVATIFVFEAVLYVLLAPFVLEKYTAVGASIIWSVRLFVEYLLLNRWVRNSMK